MYLVGKAFFLFFTVLGVEVPHESDSAHDNDKTSGEK